MNFKEAKPAYWTKLPPLPNGEEEANAGVAGKAK